MNSKNQIVLHSEGLGTLKLGPRHGDSLELTIERQSLRASAIIYLYNDYVSLLKFFEDLERHGDGSAWNGLKSWSSIEEDLKISCSIDSLGHVTLDIELTNNFMTPH